jgi:hypothetical protein
MRDSQKKERLALLKLYGALFAFLLTSGALLALFCSIASSSWRAGLKEQTAFVLEKKYPGEFAVGDFIPFTSALGVNGAAYALNNAKGTAAFDKYAVIMRVGTAYGPVVCVFMCGQGKAVFEGFASGHEIINFDSPMLFSQLSYWEKRIPDFKLPGKILPQRAVKDTRGGV